jgi:drug/metabolite transporter (DMT)-like permease
MINSPASQENKDSQSGALADIIKLARLSRLTLLYHGPAATAGDAGREQAAALASAATAAADGDVVVLFDAGSELAVPDLLAAIEAAVLEAAPQAPLAPPMAALIGYLMLGERIPLTGWVGMVVTLGGIVWVVSERLKEEDPRALRRVTVSGIMLGVVAAMGQAVGAVFSKRGMQGGYPPAASTQIRALAGIVCFAVMLTVIGYLPRVFASLKKPAAMGQMTFGAFVGPFIGVTLFHAALQRVQTGVAQTITATIPVLIIPFVIVLYKEHVTRRAIFGSVMTVVGVAILIHG